MDLHYTQATGYSQYKGTRLEETPEYLASELGLFEDVGYVQQWRCHDYSVQELTRNAQTGGAIFEGFEIDGANKHALPAYLVAIYWDSASGDHEDHIYCDNAGDFFALRMQLNQATPILGVLLSELCDLVRMGRKVDR